MMRNICLDKIAILRVLTGLTAIYRLVDCLIYSDLLFSKNGLLPESSLNISYPYFPSLLWFFDHPSFVTFFILLLITISTLFTLGVNRRIMSVLIWVGFFTLFHRNNFVFNYPSFSFFTWNFIFFSLIDENESFKNSQFNYTDEIYQLLLKGCWAFTIIAFFSSAIDKIGTPSWVNGTALSFIAMLSWRGRFLGELFLSTPTFFQTVSTYLFWFIEFLSPVFLFFPKYRNYYLFYFIMSFLIASNVLEFFFIGWEVVVFLLILVDHRFFTKAENYIRGAR